jgi:hypothetical protein
MMPALSSLPPVTSITAHRVARGFNSIAHKEASMLLSDNDAVTIMVCSVCGGPILPDQPFIERDHHPIHSESADCDPDEGWNPHIDAE